VRLRFPAGLGAIAVASIVGISIAGGGSLPFQAGPIATAGMDASLPDAAAAAAGEAASLDVADTGLGSSTTISGPNPTEPAGPAVATTVTSPVTLSGQLDAAPAAPSTAQPTGPVTKAPLGMFITNAEPLPPCGYSNIPTPLSSRSDWALTMMDTTYALTAIYAPSDLVPASEAGLRSKEPVRSLVVPDLKRMGVAAAAAGAAFTVASGYRSFHNQSVTFKHWENVQGRSAALVSSARPGHSEHQLGTAMDLKARGGPDPWTYKDWGKQTAAGIWLGANSWKYGFILSYPRGMTSKTCYEYEPWHFRYVGVAEAAAVHASGLVLREWLWEHQPNPEVPSP
jgi:zinc D-Ala-D-Ala carboxypeptidase